ncbi:MAG TPA: TonB-dependent receptor, partial [Helicobacteraceae bacterium]|nr:TonB-dependent receptor [Helicobacteraceae bacterium]
MDPAISHVPTNNIERVEVITGPFDVENFGTLSGAVKVETKTPSKTVHGDVNANVGSFNYRKLSAQVSGGEGPVRVLVGASKEASGQYQDGNGDTLAEQLVTQNAPMGNRYLPQYEGMDAYDKETYIAKAFFDISDSQVLSVGYTGNRSSDVLYPSSPMDAVYDDSDLFNINYDLKNLGSLSKSLIMQAYYSQVDHPMSNKYRYASVMMNEMTNHLT